VVLIRIFAFARGGKDLEILGDCADGWFSCMGFLPLVSHCLSFRSRCLWTFKARAPSGVLMVLMIRKGCEVSRFRARGEDVVEWAPLVELLMRRVPHASER